MSGGDWLGDPRAEPNDGWERQAPSLVAAWGDPALEHASVIVPRNRPSRRRIPPAALERQEFASEFPFAATLLAAWEQRGLVDRMALGEG